MTKEHKERMIMLFVH